MSGSHRASREVSPRSLSSLASRAPRHTGKCQQFLCGLARQQASVSPNQSPCSKSETSAVRGTKISDIFPLPGEGAVGGRVLGQPRVQPAAPHHCHNQLCYKPWTPKEHPPVLHTARAEQSTQGQGPATTVITTREAAAYPGLRQGPQA